MKKRPASGLISFILSSFVSGMLFAATGVFYVRHEISTPTMHNQNLIANMPPKKISNVMLVSFSPAMMQPLSVRPGYPSSSQSQPATRKRSKKRAHGTPYTHPSVQPLPASIAPEKAVATIEPAVALAQPIHIEHSHASETVDPLLLAAWQAYHTGEFDIAYQHYNKVLDNDAENHRSPNRDALLGMAAIAQQRSQDYLAAEFYNRILSLDPRDPDAHAGMSSLLGEKGEASTESRLKLLLAQRPEAAALHFALGNHYAQLSRWGAAEQAYFSACELESDNAGFAFNLAVSLDHLGQVKLAAQHYRRALQLDHADNTGFDRAQTQLRLNELTSQ